jgi:hypothetical protein
LGDCVEAHLLTLTSPGLTTSGLDPSVHPPLPPPFSSPSPILSASLEFYLLVSSPAGRSFFEKTTRARTTLYTAVTKTQISPPSRQATLVHIREHIPLAFSSISISIRQPRPFILYPQKPNVGHHPPIPSPSSTTISTSPCISSLCLCARRLILLFPSYPS